MIRLKRSLAGGAGLLGFVTFGSIAGCSLVVGAGDYVVGNVDGGNDAATSPDSMSSGATSGAASGSTSGASTGDTSGASTGATSGDTSGASTGASTGTTSGASTGSASGSVSGSTSGSGSGSADAGPPPVCGSTIPKPANSPDYAKLLTACVESVNCDPEAFAVSVSDCVSQDYLESAASVTSLSCLANITSCTGYLACQGERVATTAECTGATNTGVCSGTVATSCYNGNSYELGAIQDCSKLGGTCTVHAVDTTDATQGKQADCKILTTCSDAEDGVYHCNGTKLYFCSGGVGYGKDCANLNSKCVDPNDDFDNAYCVPNAPACSVTGTKCTGNDVTECTADHVSLDLKCGRSGNECYDDSSSTVCLAPGCDPPSDTTCTETCANDNVTLHMCVGNTTVSVDCSQYGFTSCYADSFNAYCIN